MLQNTFFRANVYSADLPSEEYNLVYQKDTAGDYGTELDWGKYKVVLSGAGGGGGAAAYAGGSSVSANKGSAGIEKTIYVTVLFGKTVDVTGIIGTGGGAAKAHVESDYNKRSATAGSGGAGYVSGGQGSSQTRVNNPMSCAAAGGGGGGSSSFVFSGQTTVCAGGNGGAASAKISGYTASATGGTGGSGGASSGTGASGGAGATATTNAGLMSSESKTATSTAGTAGYVRIYKSNILPQG